MQDFMDLCIRRQSCRKFADKAVEHEKLARCVEAARLAPSACNSQPWSFVVVENKELVPKVAECAQQLGANTFLIGESGPRAFIIVLEDHAVLMPGIRVFLDSQYFAKGDLGAATMCIWLEAASQGLGACVLGMYDREKLCALLDIPKDKHFGALIAVGYPADDKVRVKSRKSMDEIARFV